MSYEDFRAEAVKSLAEMTKWSEEEASVILGDVSEMHAEGIPPDEAAGHIYDALD